MNNLNQTSLTEQGKKINWVIGNYKSLLELKRVYKDKNEFLDYITKNLLTQKENSNFTNYAFLKKLDNSFRFDTIKKEINALFSELDNDYVNKFIQTPTSDLSYFEKIYGGKVEKAILPGNTQIFSFSRNSLYKEDDLKGPLIYSQLNKDIGSLIENDVVGIMHLRKDSYRGITDIYGQPVKSKDIIPSIDNSKNNLLNKVNEIQNISAGKIFLKEIFDLSI